MRTMVALGGLASASVAVVPACGEPAAPEPVPERTPARVTVEDPDPVEEEPELAGTAPTLAPPRAPGPAPAGAPPAPEPPPTGEEPARLVAKAQVAVADATAVRVRCGQRAESGTASVRITDVPAGPCQVEAEFLGKTYATEIQLDRPRGFRCSVVQGSLTCS